MPVEVRWPARFSPKFDHSMMKYDVARGICPNDVHAACRRRQLRGKPSRLWQDHSVIRGLGIAITLLGELAIQKWSYLLVFYRQLPAIPGVLHFQCVVQKNKIRPASATHAAYLPINTKPCGPVERTHAPGLDGGHAADNRLTRRPVHSE